LKDFSVCIRKGDGERFGKEGEGEEVR